MGRQPEGLYYVQGVPLPDTPSPGEAPKPWRETHVLGKPLARVDAYERVSGSAVFPSDQLRPNTLYAAILRCPHAHAVVKKVDTRAAEQRLGVRSVLSGASPEADLDWPYGKNLTVKLFDRHCRFEGEAVAAVAADTPYQAFEALSDIRVEYEVRPPVSDERDALSAQSVPVHQGGNRVGKDEVYQRGNVDKGFAEADVVLQESYRTETQIHTPTEPHGCVAQWDGDGLTIWESTQGVYAVQSAVAKVLGMPLSRLRVVGHYMGGGFGGKLQAGKYTVIAALLAKVTGRPVKLSLTREETLLAVGNRPPCNMTLKAGVKQDGRLVALDYTCLATGGAYAAGGTLLVDWLVRDLYTCPNVQCRTTDVYIHAGPARPFRAPGHPQCAWALEQMLDALAAAIDMDPVELRLKNLPTHSQARANNPAYTTTGLQACLEQGAERFGWKQALKGQTRSDETNHLRRGVGMAACLWVVGGGWPPATVIVKLFADGSVNLNMGASDIGTGTKSIMAMVVSEELGANPKLIQIEHADTATTQFASSSGGSKTVPTEAPAVRAAAIEVKRQLLKMASVELGVSASRLGIRDGHLVSMDDANRKVAIGQLAALKRRGVIVGVGHRHPNPENKVINPFGAQFCEVEVNTLTGEVRILRFLAAHDSGRVMNRLTYDSQVYGGMTMGIGLATTESRILDRGQTGKMVNCNWHTYKIPTAADVPADMTSVAIELPDFEANTTGAKGLGEPVTIPTAAAVANAVFNATGVRITGTPINPISLCSKLSRVRDGG